MIKFFKENLFINSIAIILIIIGLTVYCLDKFNTVAITKQQTILTSNSLGFKNMVKTTENNQTSASKNGIIEIKGDDIGSTYHSIDFIDSQNGWTIENKYSSENEPSKILITQDGGIHWEETELKGMIVDKLKFVNKTEGYAIAELVSNSKADSKSVNFRILKTVDGGRSWAMIWENKVFSTGSNELWFQDEANGYSLIGGSLLLTNDAGKHWFPISFGITDFIPQHVSFSNMNTGWVIGVIQKQSHASNQDVEDATKLIVMQTADSGKHWTKQFEKKYSEGPVSSIDIDFINDKAGWFLTSDLATWNGELYYTYNGGSNWKKINQIKSVRPSPTELHFVTPNTGWIPLNVGAGPIAGGLMYTKDGGKSFSVIGDGDELGINSTKEVYFISELEGWAIGMNINHGDYIIHTTDGGKTWIQIYPKLTPVEDISFIDKDHGFGLGQFMDSRSILTTLNGGKDWEGIYSFPKTFYPSFISFVDREHGFALGTAEENKVAIYKTSDGGNNWLKLDAEGFKIEGFSIIYFNFFDLNNGIIAVRSASSMYYYSTKDGGRSWQVSNIAAAKDVNVLCFTSVNTGLNVDTSRKYTYSLSLNQITNSKTEQTTSVIGSNMWPYGIDFLSKDKGWILVMQPPFKEESVMKLLYTADGRKTWSTLQFPKGFSIDTLRNQFPFQFSDKSHGWLLTRKGLMSTEDGGSTWSWIN